MKILIADDESPKLSSIRDWLCGFAPEATVLTSRSVRSTIDSIVDLKPDLVFLDMSLPTFDVAQGESGGRPQGFGGMEVLRHLDFHDVSTKVIVVTQYEAFNDNGKHVGLGDLRAEMRKDHGSTFVDCVYYNAVSDEWKIALGDHVASILGK